MWLMALQYHYFFSQSPHPHWILLCIDRSVFTVPWWSLRFHFHRWGSWPSVWTQMLRHGSTSKTSVTVCSPWKVRMCSNVWSLLSAQHMVLGMVLLCLDVTTRSCHRYLQVISAPVATSCCLFTVDTRMFSAVTSFSCWVTSKECCFLASSVVFKSMWSCWMFLWNQ